MTDYKKYLSEFPFWQKLSEEQQEYAAQNSNILKFKKGALIAGGGASCMGAIHLISGQIRVYMVSEEGREITLFRISEGENCVLSASCAMEQITFETEMMADDDCEILLIGISAFSPLVESNVHVREFTHEVTATRFSTVMWVVQQILFQKLDQRLANRLLNQYEETGSSEIKITQEQLAQDINSAREVVTRMLKQFVSEGLVEVKRGMIKIVDIEGLRALI